MALKFYPSDAMLYNSRINVLINCCQTMNMLMDNILAAIKFYVYNTYHNATIMFKVTE